ncbi:protein-disulfide reductase DsbD family protein [Phaeobacter gallaeciensis]|uniref:protein-disulfide reductase DsbD family protein n=1 Tax=Rhodobacterales TaxID=204455 RepID=UPI00237F1540|nr:protein-disulfide reductase DsbD domain-containing protein [Phaeobacter gallaeciensis]MDF1774232.1 protein-disulfide reductase DsbD family protein [Pseudophaeobacter sp. bin_em_oilr2.035]MDE4193438.1 protein-disulfide reductase DsbD family protein [Phaeobacter gallaeciensis]MDE4201713.1 protein-disulfide reductase DsbD family protein [Phaeobacter gallaeciensis]MDE4210024.1 protein-disulfide reductase DsbD family protein [Phaeobacter gallaeciensis]MDE4218392.1 protein-disulfide reductase Dsb
MMRLKTYLAGILTVLSLIASGALAATSDVYRSTPVIARLITAQNGVAPGSRSLAAGLDLTIFEGWKTYWRTPGEVGTPPRVDWSGSTNIAEVDFQWPAPERFTAFGIQNFGYHGEVVFPLRITLKQPGTAARLHAAVSLLVCSDICVPEDFVLTLDLPPGSGIDQTSADRIARFVDKVPQMASVPRITSAQFHVDDAARSLTVALRSAKAFDAPDIFPEAGDGVTFGSPDIRLGEDGRLLWARLPILSSGPPETPRITVTDGDTRAFTVPATRVVRAPAPPFRLATQRTGAGMLAGIAALAFLGGLILNVMPCVLPVLSIKFSSVLRHGPEDRPCIRRGFLAAAAGVLTFMWGLAAVLYGLKWAGVSVGWGLQFQNPVFLSALIVVMTVFSGNLLGAFEISLPSRLQTWMANNGGGDFATGLFAAVMATPCSAPLLGTAIAFALAGRGLDIAVVFTALGLGLSLPYLLVAAWPGVVTCLPKPGRWMLLVKVALGLMLLTTLGWLVWVMSGVAGPWTALIVLALALSVTGLLSLSRLSPGPRLSGAALLVAVTFVAAPFVSTPAASPAPDGGALAWQSFARAEIARQVSGGQVVFVDVTADWCLTCKANKALVLERDPVRTALSADGITLMQADWTRPDESIARYLESFDRYGIPFNVVYGPGAPEGIVLSEILTDRSVLKALDRATLPN